MLEEEKQQIRNADGKLLCEVDYENGNWHVYIKRGERITHLHLDSDGYFCIANDCGGAGIHSSIEIA